MNSSRTFVNLVETFYKVSYVEIGCMVWHYKHQVHYQITNDELWKSFLLTKQKVAWMIHRGVQWDSLSSTDQIIIISLCELIPW